MARKYFYKIVKVDNLMYHSFKKDLVICNK